MKYIKSKLSRQLLAIVGIIFAIVFICFGIVLPRMIIPVAENNIYTYLSEPLKMIENEVDDKLLNTEVAYIYIKDETVIASDNIHQIININEIEEIVGKMSNTYGKFTYNRKTYYYYSITTGEITKIAISNDTYINKTKAEVLGAILPIVFGTFLLVGLILVIWSSLIVRRIEKLKNKIDNIDNNNYNHNIDAGGDDEIHSLALAVEDMRISLINQEEYRNQMYQNISHDFKTPLTVIKSYIEAVEDEVEESETALKIIKEQTTKLEQKVHSLLYLNKLDYLKDTKVENKPVNMQELVEEEVKKFQHYRKDINFVVELDKKTVFYGSSEHWETILDNLLGNFMRYTNTTIKITTKQNRLILYNDGEKIDEGLLEGIFTPFRKGIKGEFGLGLSIVKKTLNIMDYDIVIKNEKKGVSFIITSKITRK